MWVRVLGSAAGGGFPQWNCACPCCSAVRDGSRPARARTQSSIAVSGDYRHWVLFNASPDIRAQIEAAPALRPHGLRDSPIAAVVLTDAEIDHTLGLLLLREGGGLQLHATPAVHTTLREGTGVLATLGAFCVVDWRPVATEVEVPLPGGVTYRAFDVPTRNRERFDTGNHQQPERVVGYRITEEHTGRAVVYLPGLQELTPEIGKQFEGCALLLVDGTCWRDDELIHLGVGTRTARAMGHLPMAGPEGSVSQLAGMPIARVIYVHINNTNPVLMEDSPEHRLVVQQGLEVATDGLEVRIA